LAGIETASYDTAKNLAVINVANNQGKVLSTISHKSVLEMHTGLMTLMHSTISKGKYCIESDLP
jgi:hypothetical protein